MISMTAHTVVHDVELKRLQARAEKLKDLCATVGWHQEEGAAAKTVRGKKGAILVNQRLSVVADAWIHEEGSPSQNIPARPVLGTANRNRQFIRGLVDTQASAYRKFLAGESEVACLGRIGAFWKNRVDEVFGGANSWDALNDKTIAKRRRYGNFSTAPLLDTLQLKNSVRSHVRRVGEVSR